MKRLRRNRTKMKYSIPGNKVPVYRRDANGDIVYTMIDGVSVPIETGEPEIAYSEPVEFFGYIRSSLEDAIVMPQGFDNSSNFAVLVLSRHDRDANGKIIDLPNGTAIWRKYEPTDKASGSVDETSADYIVSGVMDEELNEKSYFLKKQR